jgi:hypothetical protein
MLKVAKKRKEYRQHNQNFELRKSNFYRQLGGTQQNDYQISVDDIEFFGLTLLYILFFEKE